VGTKDGSVCVITRAGTYLKVSNALRRSERIFGRARRIEDDMCAGVAKMTCLKGPNIEVECNVYSWGLPEM
jgi:hypothetical protein